MQKKKGKKEKEKEKKVLEKSGSELNQVNGYVCLQ